MRRWGCKNNCDTWMGAEMIDEKICPFMSGDYHCESDFVMCQKERCMAWGEVPVGNGVTCKFKCRLIP